MGAATVARWNLYKNREPLHQGTTFEISKGFAAAQQGLPFDPDASIDWCKGYHSYQHFLEPACPQAMEIALFGSSAPFSKGASKVDLLAELMELNRFCQTLKKTAFADDHHNVTPDPWEAVRQTVYSRQVLGNIETLTRRLKLSFVYVQKTTSDQDEALAVIDALDALIRKL